MNLGHFLFIGLIFRKCVVKAGTPTDPVRVVCMTSGVHRFGDVRFTDPNYTEKPEEYDKYKSYGVAKSGLMLLGRELTNMYRSGGVMACWANPGLCVDTEMGGACDKAKLVEWGMCLATAPGVILIACTGHLRPDGSKINPDNWKTVAEAAAPGVSRTKIRCLEGEGLINGCSWSAHLIPHVWTTRCHMLSMGRSSMVRLPSGSSRMRMRDGYGK